MDDATLKATLLKIRTIAVVGLSPKPDRDSYRVANYLQAAGYRIIPVRPATEEILGEKCYPSLEAIPPETRVDLVNVFRRSEETPPVAQSAVAIGAGGVWLQKGIASREARNIAEGAGLVFIEDLCLMVEHRRLLGAG